MAASMGCFKVGGERSGPSDVGAVIAASVGLSVGSSIGNCDH